MGCCSARKKDKKNLSFEADDNQDQQSENPLKILNSSGTPKRNKIFKKNDKARNSLNFTSQSQDKEFVSNII